MKISPISNNYKLLKSTPNFQARLYVRESATELMRKLGKTDLFQRATKEFEQKLAEIEYYDNVVLSAIPLEWKGERLRRLMTLGKEELVMTLNNYHECGFYVNPNRTVKQVAGDLFDSYTNLEAR